MAITDRILQVVLANDVEITDENEYGTRYVMDFRAFGPRASAVIRTAWIIDEGDTIPRLTSCFVNKMEMNNEIKILDTVAVT
ncbi:MAG: hypothetical protein K1X52_13220 [Pyrinomonadaceae bacterium]|nr:hypothetical protein [Pyrinomonadaceae bacterium]